MPEELRKKVDYYEFLLDFLSHEIRNPLTSMVMFGRLLREGSYGKLSERQEQVLDRILANAHRIEHMTRDFLNLSLVESEGRPLQMEELDLYADLIVPAVEGLRAKHLFPEGAERAFHPMVPASTQVRGDRSLLNVVFDNLLFNAVKYGRPGTPIGYGWHDEEEGVAVSIHNEGQGVRPEHLADIFEKFVRLKDPTIGPQKGTGLGLYNVRTIIEAHGGRIRAESEYGRSFTVTFSLPRRPACPAGREAGA